MPGWIPSRVVSSFVPGTGLGAPDFQADPQAASRRKQQRLLHLNVRVIPSFRALGFALLSAGIILYNQFVFGEAWDAWARLTVLMVVYCAASWYALYLFYADLRGHLDLGNVFLAIDFWMLSLVCYVTGAERSGLFFLPLLAVFAQAARSFGRTLAFAHLAPLSYLAVLLYAAYVDGRTITPGPEAVKLVVLYGGGLFAAAIAWPAEQHQRSLATAIRQARDIIGDLRLQSAALEASSRELQTSLDAQASLAAENAVLYAAAQREKARQSQIFDSTSDGLIFVSPDGRIEAANVRAGDLLGFDRGGVIGVEVSRVVSRLYSVGDGDSFLGTLKGLLADPWAGGQGDLQQPSTGRVFHWVAQPARDAAGRSAGLTFTFQDVTRPRDLVRQLEDKSRLLEDARARSEDANRAKGEFLANVSHEIRTPLSAIIGMAQLMLERGPREDLLRRIQTSAEALMAIIGDILDFSKIEARKLTLARDPFVVRAALEDVIETLRVRAGEKRLTLVLEVHQEVPETLVGDPMRLRQILINLIGNALKFTEQGEVRLRVGVATELPGELCLHFTVLDTGIGIPRDKQEIVFEAFAQADGSAARRYGGTGLGLSISARLVEMMGGDIWVESEAGHGSAFRFTAIFGRALAGAVEGEALPATPVPAGRTGPLTILVVEDEDVHREVLTALLTARGHQVVTACNGREALGELSRHRIDLALMDMQMPEMDGFQTAATIRDWERSAGGRLPLIGMSASALGDDPARCLESGMDRFVTKPIDRALLFRIVDGLSAEADPVPVPPELAGRPAFLAGLGGDRALAGKLVALFITQSAALLSRIRTALAENNTEELRQAAHALKGTVSNFPAGAALGAAARMETIGLDGDIAAARELYPVLDQEVERLRALLPGLV